MRRALTLPFAFILACGPDKGDTSDTADTSNGEPATTSTGEAPTTAPTTTTNTPTTGDTTTGALSCDIYQPDDDIGPGVDITIKHMGTKPVWVPVAGCGGIPKIEILDPDQRDLFSVGSSCTPTQCHEFVALENCEQSCDNCAPPSTARIEPGASITIQWPGGFAQAMDITAECAPGLGCQGSCERPTQAPSGQYSIQLPTFHACTGACACEPMENGWCKIFEPTMVEDVTTAFVALAYPGMTAVDLVITDP